MRQALLVPANGVQLAGVPAGAALLTDAGLRRPSLLVGLHGRGLADRCLHARSSRLRYDPDQFVQVGVFDEHDGRITVLPGGQAQLARWLGHPPHRGDLESDEAEGPRRRQARTLARRGDLTGALRLTRGRNPF